MRKVHLLSLGAAIVGLVAVTLCVSAAGNLSIGGSEPVIEPATAGHPDAVQPTAQTACCPECPDCPPCELCTNGCPACMAAKVKSVAQTAETQGSCCSEERAKAAP